MWKKRVATVLAGLSWGAAGSNAIPGLPHWMTAHGMMFVLSVAISTSAYLAMHCYQRPLGDAYELGYERGRRDAMREANKRTVSPIRRQTLSTPPLRREMV